MLFRSEFLSLHIAEKGDKATAQTHIFTIKKWVIDAVRARKEKGWKGYGQANGTQIGIANPEPKSEWQTANYHREE